MRTALLTALLLLIFAVVALFAFEELDPTSPVGPEASPDAAAPVQAAIVEPDTITATADAEDERSAVEDGVVTGVRGRVIDARTLQPLAGVEVAAMKEPPSMERLMSRFRAAFVDGGGLWTQTARPPRVLGETVTGPDGSFEILGLEPGTLFLDGRSDFTFVRMPGKVRLARGQVRSGIELLGSPGGRIRGVVIGADGLPASMTAVSVRPGLNAFLGQLTQRKYRWLEAVTDAEGRFDIPGVPEGTGYTVSAAGPTMALEEVHGVRVTAGRATELRIHGHPGASIAGRVVSPDGAPVAGAWVAMVYLDMSRVLFSADGRDEPITTDGEGRFRLERVAAGRVAFVAVADDLAPSAIQERAIVDNGRYDDLELVLRDGRRLEGIVVDDQERPLAGATVDLRPMDRPRDPDVLKMFLNIRQVTAETGADGRFAVAGLTGERLFAQVSKPGYITEVRFGMKLDDDPRFVLTRGATVRGRVLDAAGEPISRFRVSTRAVDPEARGGRRRGPFGRGGRGRSGTMRLAEGQDLGDRMNREWREVQDDAGEFDLAGLPPGKLRVAVRADGFREPEAQTIELASGATSEPLEFRLEPGSTAAGIVVDAVTGSPVAEALVTAYRSREEGAGRGGMFRPRFDPEDMDFLGIAAGRGADRSATTDTKGRFAIEGLAAGAYRFTARHPDRAKASATDVEIAPDQPPQEIVIELGAGGGIEGKVTGLGGRPIADAFIVAASMQAGSFKSDSTDDTGYYRIEGLPPGMYIVFKSRMDERSSNLGYDLMSNMRLKTIAVRPDQMRRLDIEDSSEDGVRVYGTVRDAGQPMPRAMVTALGADREGFMGMGIRAQPTDVDGNYELIGLKPGDYFFQVARFQQRPQQASLSIEVPGGVTELRVDLELPQSSISGIVVDSTGQPISGIQVAAGVEDGGMEDAPGLLGLMMTNGVAQARTDDAGRFELETVAAGTYRISATGRRGRREHRQYGETAVEGVVVDGVSPIRDLVLTMPLAGRILGTVVDGSGNPVAGAELHYVRDGERRRGTDQVMDLLGVQASPAKSDLDGRFEIATVTPGRYRVRADIEGLSPGTADDVVVPPGGDVDVVVTVVKGATLRVRAKNVDGAMIPFAQVSLLDGKGKPLASKVSVMSIFKSLMGRDQKHADTGWYEVGKVPPDTYTAIITEKGKPDLSFTKTIADGETVEWEIDVAAELKARGRDRK